MLSHILQQIAEGPSEPGEICPDPKLLDGAIQVLMHGQGSPEQVAALLMGLRVRGEKAEHLQAVVEVMLEHARSFPRPNVPMLFDTCGPGGAGRSIVNISTATALLAAAAGVPVAKHGNKSVSSRSGSGNVLEALGLKLDCSPETSAKMLQEIGFCFLFAPFYHPAMKHVMPVRREIKVRSIFNLAGPLSNPARPTHQLVGVVERHLVEVMAQTLQLLGRDRALIVHGRNGMDEVSLTQVTEGLLLNSRGELEDFILSPHDLGVEMIERADLVIESPEDSAVKIKQVLEGEGGPIADEINANVAAILWLADKAADMPHAFMLAREVQGSGAGAKLLARAIEISQES